MDEDYLVMGETIPEVSNFLPHINCTPAKLRTGIHVDVSKKNNTLILLKGYFDLLILFL